MGSLPHHCSALIQTNFFIKHLRASEHPFQLHLPSPTFPNSLPGRKKITLQTTALPNSPLFLAAANSLDSSRDLSVIIPISGLLLLVYWLANFVVPDIIMKDLTSKEAAENQVLQKMKTPTPTSVDAPNETEGPLQTSPTAKKRKPKKRSNV